MWTSVAQRPLSSQELRILVQVKDPDDVVNLLAGDAPTIGPPEDVSTHQHSTSGPEFSAAEAHALATRTCILICSRTTLRLTRTQNDRVESTVVLYAWTNWSKHLQHSGLSLNDESIAESMDLMIPRLCEEVLDNLYDLNELITGSFTGSGTKDEIQQQIQVELWNIIYRLRELHLKGGYSHELEVARRKLDASGNLTMQSREQVPSSEAWTLRSSQILAETLPLFGEPERQLVESLVEIACNLKLLSIRLGQHTQWGVPSTVRNEDLVPFHIPVKLPILVDAAACMDAAASYPYWGLLPGAVLSNLPASLFTQEDVHNAEIQNIPPTAHTIDIPQLPSRRTSSFADLPPQLQGATNPLWYLSLAVPSFLRRNKPSTSPSLLKGHHIPKLVSTFNSDPPPTNPAAAWPELKKALLSSGYRIALAYLIAAILLNHLRHTFAPWLAAYTWHTPLEDLRLALSNPDVFLSDLLSAPWTLLVLSPLQRYLTTRLFDLTTRVALSPSTPSPLPPSSPSPPPSSSSSSSSSISITAKAAFLLALTHTLTTAEYTLTLLIHTAAILIALFRLLKGPPNSHQALYQLLTAHIYTLKLPFLALLLGRNVVLGIYPLLKDSLRRALLQRQWGLLLSLVSTAGFVVMLLRFRSTFFIALQVHRMFVALGYFIWAAVLLGRESLHDSVGLRASRTSLRDGAEQVSEVLSEGALVQGTARSMKQD